MINIVSTAIPSFATYLNLTIFFRKSQSFSLVFFIFIINYKLITNDIFYVLCHAKVLLWKVKGGKFFYLK